VNNKQWRRPVEAKLSLLFLDTKFPVNSSANNGVVFPQGDVTGASRKTPPKLTPLHEVSWKDFLRDEEITLS